jgi:hypothetical protein
MLGRRNYENSLPPQLKVINKRLKMKLGNVSIF